MTSRSTLGVALALVLVATGAAPAQTTMRYKFKEGDKFGYVLEQKMKMSTSVMGKDIAIGINQNMDMAWQVGKVDAAGADIKISFASIKMTMDGPMGKVEVDSKNAAEANDPVGKILGQVVSAIANMEMTFKMSENGDIKDIKIPEKVKESLKNLPGAEAMGDLLSDEGLKKMAHGGFVLPKEAVTKGKTWTQKADMKLPTGKVKGDIQFTYEGQEDKGGKKLEKIALKPNITLEADPNAQIQIKFKSQDGKGHAYFDNDAGRLIEIDSLQNMEMTVGIMDMNIQQKIEQVTTMKLKK